MRRQSNLLIPVVLSVLSVSSVVKSAEFPPVLYAAEGAAGGEGRILRYDGTGKVVWECAAPMSRDAWRLPNGNVLFCYNERYDSKRNDNPSGVREVSPEGKTVFEFKTTGQVWACQRLPDGNTLVGAASQGKLLIVDPKGTVVKEIKLLNKPGHSCIRNARRISAGPGAGNFLVAEESARAVREYDGEGKLVREIKMPFAPYSAVRLANGDTLACGQQKMVEVDARDQVTWAVEGKDYPELGVRWFAGIQVLPDGSVFVCNAGGKVPFFTIGRDKRVAWQSGPAAEKAGAQRIPMGHGVQRLDVEGEPVR